MINKVEDKVLELFDNKGEYTGPNGRELFLLDIEDVREALNDLENDNEFLDDVIYDLEKGIKEVLDVLDKRQEAN